MTKQAASQHSTFAPARTLPETSAKPSRRKVLKAAPGAALGAASLVPVAALASSGAGSARVSPSPDADFELFSLISAILNATDRLDEASRQFDAIKDSLKTSESAEEIELGAKISDTTTQYARSVGYWLVREHVPSAPAAQGEPLFEHPAGLREELDSLCVRKDELKKA